MSNDPRELSKTRSRNLDSSEDSLSPAMEELAIALAPIVPDPALRLAMVYQCFRSEPEAPYILALQSLTGTAPPAELASEIWRLTLDTQYRWSERLGEVVSLKSAAIDASDRIVSRSKSGKPEPEATASIRDYLERDLATGLYQRASYDSRVRQEVARASSREPLTLVFIQLEGIAALANSQGDRAVEDAYGNVGEVMRHHFRDGDMPCRYGADYFVALLPRTTAARAHTLAEGLLPALQQTLRSTPITANIGLAVCPDAGMTPSALENAAGAALTEARSRGPWNIATFTPPRQVPVRPNSVGKLVGASAAFVTLGAVLAGGCTYLNHHSTSGAAGGATVTSAPVANPPQPVTTSAEAAPPPENQQAQAHTPPRKFLPGQYWTGGFSVPITTYYKRHGKVELGHIYDNGPGEAVHTWNVGDYSVQVQDFKGGTHKELDVFATNRGAYEINNVHGFWTYYIHTGSLGHYGLPLNNEHRVGHGQYRQDFQNSSLIWAPKSGIWEQHRALGGRL